MISSVIGWIYFLCWSLSFYPQVLLNYKRKNTAGLSMDFVHLNFLGFLCYTIYTLAFYTSPKIQNQYKSRFGADNSVHANDVFFAVHSLLLTLITLIQSFIYKNYNAVSTSTKLFVGSTAGVGLIVIYQIQIGSLELIDGLYYLSIIKMIITLIKYLPQMYLNFERKSTVGWSIGNIILDLSGGFFSLLQVFIDCITLGNWTSISGNPVKFGMGLSSIVFDFVFIIQHYFWYTHPLDRNHNSEETEVLLSPASSMEVLLTATNSVEGFLSRSNSMEIVTSPLDPVILSQVVIESAL